MDSDTLSEQLYQFLVENSPQSYSTGRLVNLFGATTEQVTAILINWVDDVCIIQNNSRSIRYEAPVINPVPGRYMKPFKEMIVPPANPRCKELYAEGFSFIAMSSVADAGWRDV